MLTKSKENTQRPGVPDAVVRPVRRGSRAGRARRAMRSEDAAGWRITLW